MTQMATVGEIQSHQTVMGAHESLVDLQVGRAAAEALNVDSPLGRVQVECLQCTSLACELDSINVLVTTVVASTGVSFRVLVGHGRAKGIENSAGGEVLRSNQDNRFALTLDFFFLLEARKLVLASGIEKEHDIYIP